MEQIHKGIEVTANQERLWKQNSRFVRWQVRKLCGLAEGDMDFEDYVQEGFIGLMSAAVKYDGSKGTKFLTYAAWHIRKAVFRYSENCSASVRLPAYLKERVRKYAGCRQKLLSEKGREPTKEEYLAELHISERALEHLEKTIYRMSAVRLDKGRSDDGGEGSLLDLLQSDEDMEELATYSVYDQELKKALDSALGCLDKNTRVAIQSVYYQSNSMERTAELFGCSRQAICEKIRKGFWKILHSPHRAELEGFMWEGYHFNEYAYSEFADMQEIDEENEFLI